MQDLPIGMQNFESIRENDEYLYVDKTKHLLQLVKNSGMSYFLSRPRHFGKSLTISTLEAMLQGKAELFKGLYAEEWVKEQAKHPNPVIKLDMSLLSQYKDVEELNRSIINYLVRYYIEEYKLDIVVKDNAGRVFLDVINKLYKQFGPVAVLIDEYDKPITDNLNNLEKASEIRKTLGSFYGLLKGCSQVKFLMLTGVSEFTLTGIFSGLNNLIYISMDKEYSDIVGYTQKELEDNFVDWIEKTGQEMSLSKEALLEKVKEYYDGFSFDGKTRVYNPFSILNFFRKQEFNNYWYTSSLFFHPSEKELNLSAFLADYFKQHEINDIDQFRHIKVASDFTYEQEIEKASPESFLFQAGYLTISDRKGHILILDYPNEEVKQSISQLFLKDIYKIDRYISLGDNLWEAIKSLNEGNIEKIVEMFNNALTKIPYSDFPKNQNEYWYRSLFVMLLRGGAGVTSFQESYTSEGRSDLIIPFDDKIIIIEFKFAKSSKGVPKARTEGEEQVKQYAKTYENENKKIITVVLVADNRKRKVVL